MTVVMADSAKEPDALPPRYGGVILRSHDGPGALPARMATMVHEFSSLLDGSLRQLSLLSRNLHELGTTDAAEHRRDVELRVAAIRVALEQMAQTVRGVTRPRIAPSLVAARVGTSGVGSRGPFGWASTTLTLSDALRYAIAILQPRASEERIDLHMTLGDGLDRAGAGAAYTVVLNGLRNAMDAIIDARAAGMPDTGRVELSAERVELSDGFNAGAKRAWAVIVVTDDGIGPPPDLSPKPEADGSRSRAPVFESGFTTKPGHLGIGLSLSRELISEYGGSVDLRARTDRRGAELIIRLPLVEPRHDTVAGTQMPAVPGMTPARTAGEATSPSKISPDERGVES